MENTNIALVNALKSMNGAQNPEFLPDIYEAQRRQRLAQLLQQSSAQPTGSMVGNVYVAPSITQNLASLLADYGSQKQEKKAEDIQTNVANTLNQRRAQLLQSMPTTTVDQPDLDQGPPTTDAMRTHMPTLDDWNAWQAKAAGIDPGLALIGKEGAGQLQAKQGMDLQISKLNQDIEQHKTNNARLQAQLDEQKRHNQADEANAAAKLKIMTSGGLTDEAKDFMAERLLMGDKPSNVLGNIGRGTQGAVDLRDVQNRVAQKAKLRGIDATGIIQNMQSTNAEGRTLTELGAREGKIAPRVQEAQNFAQIAKQASAAVPRGSFLPWNKLSQMTDTQLGDPKLARLKAATVSLVNAYAAAVGGGVPTVHGQETAESMLSTAQSPEAYNAVVDQLVLETQQALAAPGQIKQRILGGAPTAPSQAVQTPAGQPSTQDIVDELRRRGLVK